MEVNRLTTNGMPTEPGSPTASDRPRPAASDQATFRSAETLRTAVERRPLVRPEAIERGRELLADVQYPPAELINGISKLLAHRLVP